MTLELVYERKKEITLQPKSREEVFRRLMKTTELFVVTAQDLRDAVDEKEIKEEFPMVLQLQA